MSNAAWKRRRRNKRVLIAVHRVFKDKTRLEKFEYNEGEFFYVIGVDNPLGRFLI